KFSPTHRYAERFSNVLLKIESKEHCKGCNRIHELVCQTRTPRQRSLQSPTRFRGWISLPWAAHACYTRPDGRRLSVAGRRGRGWPKGGRRLAPARLRRAAQARRPEIGAGEIGTVVASHGSRP